MTANLDRVLQLSVTITAERKELGPYMERLTALMKLEDELQKLIMPPAAAKRGRASKKDGITARVRTFLENNGPQSMADLVKALDAKKDQVANCLSQGKKRGAFSNADGLWVVS